MSAFAQLRVALLSLLFGLASCGAARHFLDEAQLQAFEAAGPVTPELDRDALLAAAPTVGPYRLGVGDLVELRGPRELFASDAAVVGTTPFELHLVRVDDSGSIEVPMLGTLSARGGTVLDLERAVQVAAHPRFLRQKPAIVARVVEHERAAVHVLGAVEKPGVHDLRSDHLTLYGALAAAGGILKSSNLVVGARLIRVRSRENGEVRELALPVKGLNVPFSDVALRRGDVVEVERYEPDTFTVVGLVNRPGAYAHPPEVTVNLMQALATAGGVDIVAAPPYATVFRRAADGTILPATFGISGNGLTDSSALRIKPGDVIVVEHTPASWTRSLFAQILRIQLGFFVDNRANS